MRKAKNQSSISFFGFLIFFLTVLVASTLSIFVYYWANKHSNGNVFVVIVSVLGIIIFSAGLCTIIDVFRRKYMIDRPVRMILNATERIASGDFSVRLTPIHEYQKYTQYDVIFENINLLSAELSKNEMLRNDFIASVSHEIKTPLAVIQNYAKSLESDNMSKTKKDEVIKGLIIQTKKLSDLITNILKLNKLENQEILPEMKKFDLSEMIRESILQFENHFENKNLNLEVDLDEITIVNSKSLLEIVVNNLLSNAVKFTNNGGTISVVVKNDCNDVVIKVKDTGEGISPEVGKHIFDKFYQSDSSRAVEGNGLGLALVKKVIDLIGGEILVESKVGVGSTFVVKLKKDSYELNKQDLG